MMFYAVMTKKKREKRPHDHRKYQPCPGCEDELWEEEGRRKE